jgi:GNAT superfamily N-acetyltransferase
MVLLAGAGPDGLAVLRFRPSIWTDALECYLAELYVTPEQRGQGLGRALMEAAIQLARSSGATYMASAPARTTSRPERSTRASASTTGAAGRTARSTTSTSGSCELRRAKQRYDQDAGGRGDQAYKGVPRTLGDDPASQWSEQIADDPDL